MDRARATAAARPVRFAVKRRLAALTTGLLAATVGAAVLAGCGSTGAEAGRPSAATSGAPLTGSAAPTSTASPTSTAAATRSAPAYRYYLSVRDSLAFGFQLARFERELAAHSYSPATFHTGYSDLLLAALRRINAGIAGANLGCPGETTLTFRRGGCPTVRTGEALHAAYTGSQQAAAVRFLAAHPGPGLITVSLGANDLNGVLDGCPGLSVSCIEPKLPAIFTQVQTQETVILTTLRRAAPRARIVLLEPYNPYVVSAEASDFVVQALNTAIGAAARANGVRTVDAYGAFNGAGDEKRTVCRLTAYCSNAHDIHPTDAGYQVLAELFVRAAS